MEDRQTAIEAGRRDAGAEVSPIGEETNDSRTGREEGFDVNGKRRRGRGKGEGGGKWRDDPIEKLINAYIQMAP